LSYTLFAFACAGNIEDAVKLCRDAHQPWHAASIRGSLLFLWPAICEFHLLAIAAYCYLPEAQLCYVLHLATAQQYDIADEGEEGDPDLWYGNKRRALWKTTCTHTALDSRLSSTEHALYTVLAPSVQTSTVLKSSCPTWEDVLWATISVLCEERQSEVLAVEWGFLGAIWERVGRR
jgi:nuclear pore complex protein Nup107